MCSEKLFEKRGYVLPNYVDAAKYEFSPQRRAAAREKLGLSDELIIGHVGSIYWIKNQTFLVSLLAELLKTELNSRLMLVGDERDDGETRALAEKLGVSDKVILRAAGMIFPICSTPWMCSCSRQGLRRFRSRR